MLRNFSRKAPSGPPEGTAASHALAVAQALHTRPACPAGRANFGRWEKPIFHFQTATDMHAQVMPET